MGWREDSFAGEGFRLVETHISSVLLGERDVFKRKKPVDLGFLDFRTLAARRAACEAEVRLNARLAPDVYLGVVEVRRDASGRERVGAEGELVDYAVHMRRLPDEDRADVRLDEGRLSPEDVDRIAARIARFHADAETTGEIARYGSPETIERNVSENFEQTRDTLPLYLGPDEIVEIEEFHRRTVAHRAPFLERMARGRIRDGHGDLRLEHVYLDDSGDIRIIDCIEFNERFRYQDVAADVAFLAMDFARSGASALGERFLARYAREAQDYDLYPLVDFYQSYRAFVRGKVATFVARDERTSPAAREEAHRRARHDFLLALSFERPSIAPACVVAVGGLVASGKSTLAEAIAARVVAPIVDSDRARKHLAGVSATERLAGGEFTGAYSPSATDAVYDEVFRRAELVLRSGRPVVLDASFRARAHRARARTVAEAASAPFYFVECRADRAVIEERLRARASRDDVVSDAREHVLDAFASRFEPVDELPPSCHRAVDTTRGVEEAMRALDDLLPEPPPS